MRTARTLPQLRIILHLFLFICLALWAASPAGAKTCDGPSAPAITGPVWLNSQPLGAQDLRGKPVLVEFWTLGCRNCRNVEPYVKSWHTRYASQGLVIVGVHTPEFDYERNPQTVAQYVKTHEIRHPVVLDNDYAIWNRYGNRYWPAMYLFDREGRLCHRQIGEGGYAEMARRIEALLE